jgi:iron(III) transport system permease protein
VDRLLTVAIVVVAMFLVLVPLGTLLWGSFRTDVLGLPGETYTLHNFVEAYTDRRSYAAIGNSFVYAAGSTVISMVIATVMAWAVERTNMPGRKLVFALMLVPLAIPAMLFAISWIMLLSPQIGIINGVLRAILGVFGIHPDSGPLNIYSLPGMIFLEGIRHVPTIFLILAASFRNVDPGLEEASLTSGSSVFRTLRRVTVPVLWPAVLSATMLCFMSVMESFEIPGIIGLPANVYVFSTRIYFAADLDSPPDIGLASAFAVTFLLISLILLWLYRRTTRHADAFATVTGKGFRARVVDLGKWRFVPLVLVLLWASMLQFFQAPSHAAFAHLSMANYRALTSLPLVAQAVRDTAILTVVAASVTMVLSFLSSWLAVRTKSRGGRLLDSLMFLPQTIPGIVIGMALVIVYLGPLKFIPIYGTLAVVGVALVTRYLAFGTRTANAALIQVHRELEEAAYVSGSTRLRALRTVVLPLVFAAFANGWIWVAVHSIREVSMPLMLLSRETPLVSTQIWYLWKDGQAGQTAALGVVLIVVLVVLTVAGRFIVDRKVR